MIRVGLLKGCVNNQDYDLTRLLDAVILSQGVISGLAVTASTVSAGYGFAKVTRTEGQTFYVMCENTDDVTIDTTGTKKVRLQLDQALIDDGSTINSDHSNVASIATGADRPAVPHLKLATITSGTIVDSRETPQMRFGLSKGNYAEIVDGLKTFTTLPRKSGSLDPTDDAELITLGYLQSVIDNFGEALPDASPGEYGVVRLGDDITANAGSSTTHVPTMAQLTRVKTGSALATLEALGAGNGTGDSKNQQSANITAGGRGCVVDGYGYVSMGYHASVGAGSTKIAIVDGTTGATIHEKLRNFNNTSCVTPTFFVEPNTVFKVRVEANGNRNYSVESSTQYKYKVHQL